MSLDYRVPDVFDRLAEIPDGSIDLIVTSPPFLALRSYLPADHPDKGKEIGSEATPADFLDTLLALSAEWGRVLAPHGSLCVELGDTYAGSKLGGVGSYGQIQDGQQTAWKPNQYGSATITRGGGHQDKLGTGWPLAKSRTMIDTLYPACLAYGRNLLTGQPSPAGQWRIRNLIVWARPNPPVGALGDKFRPATSYITVACRSAKRYFDLDAVRTEPSIPPEQMRPRGEGHNAARALVGLSSGNVGTMGGNPAGAPPLDWHADHHPEDGDWLWKLSTQPYAGSHYATFPMALPKRLIEAMCPLRVCTVCGRPSERITGEATYIHTDGRGEVAALPEWEWGGDRVGKSRQGSGDPGNMVRAAPTIGWTDCGCLCGDCGGTGVILGPRPPALKCRCDNGRPWRTGICLDPFAGSGTTLEAAQAVGRHAIGIDLDARNADLARSRVGMFLDIDHGTTEVVAPITSHNPTSLNGHSRFPAGYLRNDGRVTPQAKDYGT